ncbi:Hypp1005 [Branchiostoma lanceolatum]|uniref:Hypp1005 protein n=1 Tax=Branchiostoma lanceolatum TaxID=7740 RepID=A0A8J9ZDT8_BRALA|nr:Hypp1005 [Branchiostoma lanceolatum]
MAQLQGSQYTRFAWILLVCVLNIVDCSSSTALGRRHLLSDDDDASDHTIATLTDFWQRVKAAVQDTEVKLDDTSPTEPLFGRDDPPLDPPPQTSALANDIVTQILSAVAHGNEQRVSNEDLLSNLTARVVSIESELARVRKVNDRLQDQVRNMTSIKKASRDKRRRHHSSVARLSRAITRLQGELEKEKHRVRRYEEELAFMSERQERLEGRIAEITLMFRDQHPVINPDPSLKVKSADGGLSASPEGSSQDKTEDKKDGDAHEEDEDDYYYDYNEHTARTPKEQ